MRALALRGARPKLRFRRCPQPPPPEGSTSAGLRRVPGLQTQTSKDQQRIGETPAPKPHSKPAIVPRDVCSLRPGTLPNLGVDHTPIPDSEGGGSEEDAEHRQIGPRPWTRAKPLPRGGQPPGSRGPPAFSGIARGRPPHAARALTFDDHLAGAGPLGHCDGAVERGPGPSERAGYSLNFKRGPRFADVERSMPRRCAPGSIARGIFPRRLPSTLRARCGPLPHCYC